MWEMRNTSLIFFLNWDCKVLLKYNKSVYSSSYVINNIFIDNSNYLMILAMCL